LVTANDIIIPAESVLIILRFVSSRVCVNQCGPQTTSPCIAFRAISSPAPVSFSVSRSPTRDAQPRHTKKECVGSLSSEIVLSRLTAAASVRTCDAVSAGWLVMIKWSVEALFRPFSDYGTAEITPAHATAFAPSSLAAIFLIVHKTYNSAIPPTFRPAGRRLGTRFSSAC